MFSTKARNITIALVASLSFGIVAAASASADVLGKVTEFSATGNAEVITAGPDGNLWFTEPNTGRIGRSTPSGEITEFSELGGSSPELLKHSIPTGITAGPDGNLWFTEFS